MTVYVLDANILITMQRRHPRHVFPNMWQQFEKSIASGDIRIPEMVIDELSKGDDNLFEWAKTVPDALVPFDQDQEDALNEVMSECPTLSDPQGDRNRADPFVVAASIVLRATVVTGERARRDVTDPMKIPDACDHFGVPWLGFWEFLIDVGWQL